MSEIYVYNISLFAAENPNYPLKGSKGTIYEGGTKGRVLSYNNFRAHCEKKLI